MSSTLADSIPVPVSPDERVVARWDGIEVVLITSDDGAGARELAARVALRAMRDTPFHTPAYTATDQEPESRVFLAREAGQAIGLVVLRPRRRWAWWAWDDFDAERRPSTGVAPLTAWTVETVWTHAASQSRGLAKRLLEVAARQVEVRVESFGWRRPFTPSGEALVRRCCPGGFWVPD